MHPIVLRRIGFILKNDDELDAHPVVSENSISKENSCFF